MTAALFLDRDDTLIEDPGYLHRPDDVVLLPGVRAAMGRLAAAFRLFLFTNQSGIGRGYYRWEHAQAVNRRLVDLLALPRGFDAVCLAWERPEQTPVYRKPAPRFILECIRDYALDPTRCWMVGDRLSDLRAGIRAGIRGALVRRDGAMDDVLRTFITRHAVPVFSDLESFADQALADSNSNYGF